MSYYTSIEVFKSDLVLPDDFFTFGDGWLTVEENMKSPTPAPWKNKYGHFLVVQATERGSWMAGNAVFSFCDGNWAMVTPGEWASLTKTNNGWAFQHYGDTCSNWGTVQDDLERLWAQFGANVDAMVMDHEQSNTVPLFYRNGKPVDVLTLHLPLQEVSRAVQSLLDERGVDQDLGDEIIERIKQVGLSF